MGVVDGETQLDVMGDLRVEGNFNSCCNKVCRVLQDDVDAVCDLFELGSAGVVCCDIVDCNGHQRKQPHEVGDFFVWGFVCGVEEEAEKDKKVYDCLSDCIWGVVAKIGIVHICVCFCSVAVDLVNLPVVVQFGLMLTDFLVI